MQPEPLAQTDAANDSTAARKRDLERTHRRDQSIALIDRLEAEGAFDLSTRLRSCGESFKLVCTCCGDFRESEVHCMARYCPACQPLVVAERVARWKPSLDLIRWPLFITLTIPNSEDPERLRFLKKRWSAFRRRKLIRTRIRGGLASFEITNIGNGWHPHLHALADCRWLSLYTPEPDYRDSEAVKDEKCQAAREELSTLWADQIGEETAIVLATRAFGDRVILEICKYAAKGSDLLECPTPIAPMLRVLKATRTLAGWGSCFPLPSPDEDPGPKIGCETCGALKSFLPSAVVSYLTKGTDPGWKGRTVAPSSQAPNT